MFVELSLDLEACDETYEKGHDDANQSPIHISGYTASTPFDMSADEARQLGA